MFVCHTVLSVPCSLVVNCWERADLFALLYVMFSCVLSLLGQVWYLIVLIPDLCLLPYFYQYCRFSLIFIGLDKYDFKLKTRNIFITHQFNKCFECSKNNLIA